MYLSAAVYLKIPHAMPPETMSLAGKKAHSLIKKETFEINPLKAQNPHISRQY